MATVRNATQWSFPLGGTTLTITIPAAQAGATLILVCGGGATVTAAHVGSSGGPSMTQRASASGSDLSDRIFDYVATGGETSLVLTLNGPNNMSGVVYEIPGLGAFIGASSNGSGTPINNSVDRQLTASSAVAVTGPALGVGAWYVPATSTSNAFNGCNQMMQVGPYGKIWVSATNQPGTNQEFTWASALVDVDASHSYPKQLSAGSYQITSIWPTSNPIAYATQAFYIDTTGVATNPAFASPLVKENSLPGTHKDNWASGFSSNGIAGYCDKVSYQPGDTVNFKVDSLNNPFRVEIYRLGYYGWEQMGARSPLGNGAGYITGTPVTQSSPTVDSTLGSTSCAWTTNATWTIPSDAQPGVYDVLYRRTDNTALLASGVFVVRPASFAGKIVMLLPDFTWQAYNTWGATTDFNDYAHTTGRSLYQLGSGGNNTRSYAVSFDRPYITQTTNSVTFLFDAEHPLLVFLEAQGYDMAYCTCTDLDIDPTLLLTAKLVIVAGHHEYWSKNVYDGLINTANAGVNMMFLSGNTAGWRTRFAAGDTARRTMICYKDGLTKDSTAGFTGTGYDPGGYTGTWRDTRTVAGQVNNPDIRAEQMLLGQRFVASAPVNGNFTVPFAQKGYPLWRNSPTIQALSSGGVFTTVQQTCAVEVDSPDGSAGQPANLVNVCPTALTGLTGGSNAAGTLYTTTVSPTCGITMYRRASGALIVATSSWHAFFGVTRWQGANSWGSTVTLDPDWQNALLCLLYDLGATPIAVRQMEPAIDPGTLVNPATGAPPPGRTGTARAYGLTCPEDGRMLMFA